MYKALPMILALAAVAPQAESAGPNWEARLKMRGIEPCQYICYKADAPIVIDGRIGEAAWEKAPWTEYHLDIEGPSKPKPRYKVRSKMLWDGKAFYIAAHLEEPHVWATLTRRDSVIFYDNDFEIFIDPDGDTHGYYEIEINPLNTVWDLFLAKPYKDGGPAENGWDAKGLQTAVHVDGTLNDPSDEDRGWSVEFSFPWSSFDYRGQSVPVPEEGEQWRVNFSRVQWQHTVEDGRYVKVPNTREDNWIWSPQGIVDMHRPEKWAYVQFTGKNPGEASFKPDETRAARRLLFDLYYQQRDYFEKHGRWAAAADELDLPYGRDELDTFGLSIRQTEEGYEAAALAQTAEGTKTVRIRHDARIAVD